MSKRPMAPPFAEAAMIDPDVVRQRARVASPLGREAAHGSLPSDAVMTCGIEPSFMIVAVKAIGAFSYPGLGPLVISHVAGPWRGKVGGPAFPRVPSGRKGTSSTPDKARNGSVEAGTRRSASRPRGPSSPPRSGAATLKRMSAMFAGTTVGAQVLRLVRRRFRGKHLRHPGRRLHDVVLRLVQRRLR